MGSVGGVGRFEEEGWGVGVKLMVPGGSVSFCSSRLQDVGGDAQKVRHSVLERRL
jgi:hypothetical protein